MRHSLASEPGVRSLGGPRLDGAARARDDAVMRVLAFAGVSLLAAGCYCSHEVAREDAAGIDAGRASIDAARDAPADAAPDGAWDAGPTGDRYWIAVPAAGLEVAVERCELREGQAPIVRVRIVTDACDEPGNAWLERDPAMRVLRVRAFTWRPMNVPPCPPATREIVRDVTLDPRTPATLEEGEWRAIAPDGASVPFRVEAGPPELTCTDCIAPGAPCSIDQECAGERRCVAMRGDAACDSRCEVSCQPFPDEAGGSDLACSAALGGAATCAEDPSCGWICAAAERDLCPTCPEGQQCVTDAFAGCRWAVSPFDGGSECEGDADCREGYSCVERDGWRSCQIRCRGDHLCPYDSCAGGLDVCPVPKV